MRCNVDILLLCSLQAVSVGNALYVVSHFQLLLASVCVCCGFVVFTKCHCFMFIRILSIGVEKTDSYIVTLKLKKVYKAVTLFSPIIVFEIMLDSKPRNVTRLSVL
jgi:hypothetical protein